MIRAKADTIDAFGKAMRLQRVSLRTFRVVDAVLLLLLTAPAAFLQAGGTGGGMQEGIARFLADLKGASARRDAQAIAALVRFPLVVNISGVRVPVQNAAELVERFDAIFMPELRDAIAASSAVKSGEGFALANNLVQVTSVADSLKITAITVPPAAAAPGRAATNEGGKRG